MRKIVFERPDGGVSIVSVGNFGEDVAWADLPDDAINPRWVDESEIPADRTKRDALKFDLTHDEAKLAEIAARPNPLSLEERLSALEALIKP